MSAVRPRCLDLSYLISRNDALLFLDQWAVQLIAQTVGVASPNAPDRDGGAHTHITKWNRMQTTSLGFSSCLLFVDNRNRWRRGSWCQCRGTGPRMYIWTALLAEVMSHFDINRLLHSKSKHKVLFHISFPHNISAYCFERHIRLVTMSENLWTYTPLRESSALSEAAGCTSSFPLPTINH